MRKAIVGAALILMLLFVISCGVPQEEYDAVSSDLAIAQAEIQSLQSDLSAKETELSAKETELAAAQAKLEQGKARIEVLKGLTPAIIDRLDVTVPSPTTDYFLWYQDKVNAIRDPILTEKFEAIIDSDGSNETMRSFLFYLLESITKTLE